MKKLYFFIAVLTSLMMTAQNDITFSVDMSSYGTSFTTVYVSGELNGWSGTANPMVDMGGGIWSATISLADGEYQYKFSHDDWAGQDNLIQGEACTVTDGGFTNRYLAVNGANQTLDTPSFSTCYDDGNAGPYNTTFIVDMSGYAGAFTTVHVSGAFNGWSGTANPMVDIGSGMWSTTISMTENSHEFKFSVDDWADQENFMPDAAGTITNGGFTNRFVNVLGDESRSYVWGAGGSITLSTNEVVSAANFIAYPNPTNDAWNVATNNTTITSVRVYDISGKQVLTLTPNASTVSIDGGTLQKGIYFANIQSDKGQSSIKLVKN
ncbi:T9SS type A sorting domain-containing protein [Kordia sp. YSTF-M3]|uniref:T9SS type A sorting domain-containing protein n=1 Tax=Kordia aestuariivivens TaxID=2759037 RepID=A0ABR7QDC6_9FLAO|nr:T9SS type A sorting domain-containing protein [Kordia aestuariivivens]MBC8756396.1 T9SS type A sorting domain-containing protein [Kordia aestuariivivens]